MIAISGIEFEVLQDEKEGWDEEAFKARYSDVLNKYDYIVGDWGYNQLRLRGFLMIKIKNRRLIKKSAHSLTIYMNTAILAVLILF